MRTAVTCVGSLTMFESEFQPSPELFIHGHVYEACLQEHQHGAEKLGDGTVWPVALVKEHVTDHHANGAPGGSLTPSGCCNPTNSSILELLAGKNQSLLIGRDSFPVLDLGFDAVGGVRRLDVQGDRLA